MQKITPFLWFDDKAEEAMNFISRHFQEFEGREIFIGTVIAPGGSGKVMSVTFELDGQPFMAMNGGPHFTFSPAISMFVNCETQSEVDELWEKLSAGGEKSRCGWLKDKYGLSWQIIPSALGTLLHDKDPAKAKRVMQAMMQMTKIDIKALQLAHEGVAA